RLGIGQEFVAPAAAPFARVAPARLLVDAALRRSRQSHLGLVIGQIARVHFDARALYWTEILAAGADDALQYRRERLIFIMGRRIQKGQRQQERPHSIWPPPVAAPRRARRRRSAEAARFARPRL